MGGYTLLPTRPRFCWWGWSLTMWSENHRFKDRMNSTLTNVVLTCMMRRGTLLSDDKCLVFSLLDTGEFYQSNNVNWYTMHHMEQRRFHCHPADLISYSIWFTDIANATLRILLWGAFIQLTDMRLCGVNLSHEKRSIGPMVVSVLAWLSPTICKGTVHFRIRTYNSNCGCATPTPLTPLWLCLRITSSSPASLRLLSLPTVQSFLTHT